MTRRIITRLAFLGIFMLSLNLLLAAFFLTTTQEAAASNHREAPLISQDPVADSTDL